MRWREPIEINVPDDLRAAVGGHPLIAERLARDGLIDPSAALAFLTPESYRPASPFDFPGMERAVDRVSKGIRADQRILIWGDFDVDGQSATALLYSTLARIGANVTFHMPVREGEGHGINPRKLREVLKGEVDLIITCDTGTTAYEGLDIAKAAGVDVIITDHHLLGEKEPDAFEFISTQRLPNDHAKTFLPGVGVAFELLSALSLKPALDLAALGIVADMATLKADTRYLLQRGLEAMRISERPGLRALIERSEINQPMIIESDIGYRLAPRLNALGRLSDARLSVELLTTSNATRAVEIADQIEALNAQRKLEARLVEDSANVLIEKDPSLLSYHVLVLSHPDWSGGATGIVANRLAETFHRPVVLLCERGESVFGSARSIPGIDISQALANVRDLLGRFGGHPAAAGLSLHRDSVFEFRRRLSRTVREQTEAAERPPEPELQLDGSITLDESQLELASDIARLAPFGEGNPPLTLAVRDLKVIRQRKLGRSGDHRELLVEDEKGIRGRVVWWNAGENEIQSRTVDIATTLRISRYKGKTEPLLELIDIAECVESEIASASPAADKEIVDLINVEDPRRALAEMIQTYPEAVVWKERDQTVTGEGRTGLRKAETLIIWTHPPGPEELEAALKRVKPKRIIRFNRVPPALRVDEFLKTLGGMLKYAIRSKDGLTSLEELATALAERESTVRYGIEWLKLSGTMEIEINDNGGLVVRDTPVRTETTPAAFERIKDLLTLSLAETASYRRSREAERERGREAEKKRG